MRISNKDQLAALLQEARKKTGKSQTDLGGEVGMTRKTVNKLEKDPISSEIGNLIKAVSALGLELHINQKPRISHIKPESFGVHVELAKTIKLSPTLKREDVERTDKDDDKQTIAKSEIHGW